MKRPVTDLIEHLKNLDHIKNSLGSLGGGNHFIEIDESKDGTKYLIIHSGSRNLGKQVAEGCFGSAQRADVGMKYLALDGRKLKSLTGFEATVRLEEVIKHY